MSGSGGSPVALVIVILAGNVAYLVATIILSTILGVAPTDIFSGPFSAAASSLVTVWATIGGLLGLVDFLAVFGFISSLTNGW